MQGWKADNKIIFGNMQVMLNIISAIHFNLGMFEVTINFYKYSARYFLCEISPMTLLCAL